MELSKGNDEKIRSVNQPEAMPELFEQPGLELNFHSDREVRWINVTMESKRRLLGRKTLMHVTTAPDSIMPQYTTLKADDIHTLEDPQLRAALQLQDAAEAADWFEHSPGHKSAHFATVYATSEGTYATATFTGIEKDGVDTFMENLRRFDPAYDGLYRRLG